MAKKILKHFCIYNTQTREIMNVRTVDVTTKVSEELGDWFDVYPKEESEPLLWEYEKARYEKGAQGLGSANGWCAYCGDEAFTWEMFDAEKAKEGTV
jgi:hypothetical protein